MQGYTSTVHCKMLLTGLNKDLLPTLFNIVTSDSDSTVLFNIIEHVGSTTLFNVFINLKQVLIFLPCSKERGRGLNVFIDDICPHKMDCAIVNSYIPHWQMKLTTHVEINIGNVCLTVICNSFYHIVNILEC